MPSLSEDIANHAKSSSWKEQQLATQMEPAAQTAGDVLPGMPEGEVREAASIPVPPPGDKPATGTPANSSAARSLLGSVASTAEPAVSTSTTPQLPGAAAPSAASTAPKISMALGIQTSLRAAKALSRLRQKRKIIKSMPADVDLSIPGIADAWIWFQEIDIDGSEKLDWEEMTTLVKKLGLTWGKRKIRGAYNDMTSGLDRGVSFSEFAVWWSRQQAVARREIRRQVSGHLCLPPAIVPPR